MIFDAVDTDVFQYYLDHSAQESPLWTPNADCSSSTTPVGIKLSDSIGITSRSISCRGYSPDFNPIERLWLCLKADFFSDFIAKSPEQLTQRLCRDLTSLMNDPETVASQCAFGNDLREML